MAKIGFGGEDEKKNPATGNSETPGKEGSSTGTNIFGSVVPNKVVVGAGTPEKPAAGNQTKPTNPPKAEANIGTAGLGNYKPITSIKDYIPGSQVSSNAGKIETTTNEQKAETALADLRNDYMNTLQNQYNYSADKLKAERDAAMRENWILQQQAEANLPEKLAAEGINGGATETEISKIRAEYQGNRNDIREDYSEELNKIGEESRKELFENEKDFNKEWLEYLLGIAKAEETGKFK
jgi:hypothetical protein